MVTSLQDDPRWVRLHDREWICPCCKLVHAGLFDLAYDKPDPWHGDDKKRSNSEVKDADNILTDDFCILDGEHFFVRGILEIPVIGSPTSTFAFGVWSSLSKSNFDLYVENFERDQQETHGPWFGWLSNRLKGYPDTLFLKCQVHPQSDRERPRVEFEQIEHPLVFEQQNGITFDRLLELYAENGHDLRDALSG